MLLLLLACGASEDSAAEDTALQSWILDPVAAPYQFTQEEVPKAPFYDGQQAAMSVFAQGDLDADGVNDLVVMSYNPVLLWYLPGVAGGGLGEPDLLLELEYPHEGVLADLTGDGVADFALVGQSSTLLVGGGSLAFPDGGVAFEQGCDSAVAVVTDGTGVPLLVSGCGVSADTALLVHSFDADGNASCERVEFPDLYGVSDVENIGDVNGDGYADLALGVEVAESPFLNRVVVSLGGAQGFSWSVDHTLEPAEPDDDFFGLSIAGLGDVDGDGMADFAVGGKETVAIYKGSAEGPQLWQRLQNPEPDETTFGHVVAPAGDLNGDGVPDLVVDSNGYLAYAGGQEGFGEAPMADSRDSWVSEGGLRGGGPPTPGGDINGDGVDDMVLALSSTQRSNGPILWYGSCRQRHYADLDGDGFGDPETFQDTCAPDFVSALTDGDCDDTHPGVNPLAPETPGNALDEDCDGVVEPGDTGVEEEEEAGSCSTTPGTPLSLWVPALLLGLALRRRGH
ncbi:MAG: VCBS repeat-containing protein [Myxococcota bacterium]|nr:VCBS repeat-containing protein [Myxococcota bacterium]